MDFTSVSVRERITQKTLMELFPELKVQLTLDPTLLLEDSDWNAIVSSKKIKSNYLFCYFLGNNEEYRNLAKEYASKNGLVLATIPHMQGRVEEADLGYGDIKLYDVTPQDFLSYVKNADVIFTDSFHACVFCQIFKKQFFVFGRSDRKEMNNRIENLTQLFNAEERFIVENTKIDINYIEKLNCIEYSYENLQDYEKLKQDSIHFLMDSITNL